MAFDPTVPTAGNSLRATPIRDNFNALHDETAAILSDVTPGALPIKTGDGALGDSALSETANNVIVQSKLLSIRRGDGADAILLEVHNGTEPVLHIRITADGGRIAFSSNRPGFSFQTPLDVNGAPVALKPTSIAAYTGSFSDPPTQSEMQSFAAYVESLRAALVG